MDSPTLDTFPADLLTKIAESLPPRSISHLAAVCRATSAATTGPPSVWELLLALQLRAAAAAVAAAAREAAAPTGVAPAVLPFNPCWRRYDGEQGVMGQCCIPTARLAGTRVSEAA